MHMFICSIKPFAKHHTFDRKLFAIVLTHNTIARIPLQRVSYQKYGVLRKALLSKWTCAGSEFHYTFLLQQTPNRFQFRPNPLRAATGKGQPKKNVNSHSSNNPTWTILSTWKNHESEPLIWITLQANHLLQLKELHQFYFQDRLQLSKF